MQRLDMLCCATPPACTCCDAYNEECECADPQGFIVRMNYTQEWDSKCTPNLGLTDLEVVFTIGGTRTTYYSSGLFGCPEGTIIGYSFSEMGFDLKLDWEDFGYKNLPVCYFVWEWDAQGNPIRWSTTAEGITYSPCVNPCLCNLYNPCDGWPAWPYIAINPQNSTFSLGKHKIRVAGTINNAGCPVDCEPLEGGGSDPVLLSCTTETCALGNYCPRYVLEYTGCQQGDCFPLFDGTEEFSGAPCGDPPESVVDIVFAALGWSLISDCACTSRSPWQNGRIGSLWNWQRIVEDNRGVPPTGTPVSPIEMSGCAPFRYAAEYDGNWDFELCCLLYDISGCVPPTYEPTDCQNFVCGFTEKQSWRVRVECL